MSAGRRAGARPPPPPLLHAHTALVRLHRHTRHPRTCSPFFCSFRNLPAPLMVPPVPTPGHTGRQAGSGGGASVSATGARRCGAVQPPASTHMAASIPRRSRHQARACSRVSTQRGRAAALTHRPPECPRRRRCPPRSRGPWSRNAPWLRGGSGGGQGGVRGGVRSSRRLTAARCGLTAAHRAGAATGHRPPPAPAHTLLPAPCSRLAGFSNCCRM